jgi:hypothetical protein
MSNPSFDNIDKWLFEYTEGNLSSHHENQLNQFLVKNPEFEMDLDAWESAKVEASVEVYADTDSHHRKPIAWMLSSSIFVSAGLALGIGWFALNNIENSTQVESVARTNEITYIKKIRQNSLNTSSDSIDFTLSWSQSTKDFLNLTPSNSTSKPLSKGNAVGQSSRTIKNKELIATRGINILKDINEKLGDIKTTNLLSEISKTENIETIDVYTASQTDYKRSVNLNDNAIENTKAVSRSNEGISSNYNKSISAKLKSTIRKIIRMTDNPIALTNSKDIYYHTPGMQALDVNFGSVGSLLVPRIQSLSRAQWTGHGNQQIYNQISFDTYVREIRGGIGVQLNHVHYGNGAYQVGQFALMYSPKFSVTKNVVLEPAIRFKMGNKRLSNQKMVPGQLVELDRQNELIYENESLNTSTQNLWYKDVGFALMSNTKWFSAGIQIDNIGRHYSKVFESSDENDYAERHITATLGTDYVSRTKLFSFSPYIMYQKMENLSEIWGGSIFRYKKFIFGGGISSLGDYAGSIGIKTNRLMITYAVDNTQSVLAKEGLFSQQFTLRILTNRGSNNRRMLK